MGVTVTGRLNKPASMFTAQDSTGFGVQIGVKYYDRETKTDQWTNYECAVFSKNQNQIQFYQQTLIEGAIIEITGNEQKIKQFQGNSGISLLIEIMGARLGFVGQSAPKTQQQPQQNQQFNQQNTNNLNQPQQGNFQQSQQQGGFGQPQQNQNTPVSNGGFNQNNN